MLQPDPNLTLIVYVAWLIGLGVVSLFLSGISFLLWSAFKGASR